MKSHPLWVTLYILCLSVCLYPINVKTAEPIRPKFSVGLDMSTGKFKTIYRWSKLKDLPPTKFDLNKMLNIYEILFYKSQLLQCIYREKMFTIKIKNGRLKSLVYYIWVKKKIIEISELLCNVIAYQTKQKIYCKHCP